MENIVPIASYSRKTQTLFDKALQLHVQLESNGLPNAQNSGVLVTGATYAKPYSLKKMIVGSNSETGMYNDSVHCEEDLRTIAAKMKTKGANGGPLFYDEMVIISNTSHPLAPCGGCLDLLSESVKPDFRIITSTAQGQAFAATIQEMLPNADYLLGHGASMASLRSLDREYRDLISVGREFLSRQSTLANDKPRFAALFTPGHEPCYGVTVSQPGFRGAQAVQIAASNAIMAIGRSKESLPFPVAVLVTGDKGPILPFGVERQWLSDIAKNQDEPVTVYCVSSDDKVLVTDSEHLLPYAITKDLEMKIRGSK